MSGGRAGFQLLAAGTGTEERDPACERDQSDVVFIGGDGSSTSGVQSARRPGALCSHLCVRVGGAWHFSRVRILRFCSLPSAYEVRRNTCEAAGTAKAEARATTRRDYLREPPIVRVIASPRITELCLQKGHVDTVGRSDYPRLQPPSLTPTEAMLSHWNGHREPPRSRGRERRGRRITSGQQTPTLDRATRTQAGDGRRASRVP